LSRDQNTIALVEAALMTALTAILAIAGFYLPLMGYLLFIIAVPFIIMSVRHSGRYVITSALAAAVLVSFLTFPTYGIYIALLGGAVGFVMGYFLKRQKDSSTVIFYGALMTTVSLFVMFSLAALVSGINIMDMVTGILDETVLLTENMGLGEIVANSEVSIAEMMEIFKMVIPSSLILSGVIFALVNYFFASIILKRMGSWSMPPKPFSQFTLPANILIGTSLIIVLTYLAGKLNIVDSEVLFVNVMNVFIYVFMVQGIAVIFHLMEKRNLGKGLKTMVVVIIFITGMTMAAAVLGWVDSAIDFRRIRKRD
jgi:uncharacterized protein YybS (DUF2232 family)